MKKVLGIFSFFIFTSLNLQAFLLSRQNLTMKSADVWLTLEAKVAEVQLLKNISAPGTQRGVVIASPQTENPNYFRNWVRDGALTMDVVFQLWRQTSSPVKKAYYGQMLQDYLEFSRSNQLSANLGEPIFEVTGVPFFGPWGRPQNDGPALRAIVLIKWAQTLLDQGHKDFVLKKLYESVLPSTTVIKSDLEYVSWHWSEPCFDLWEEVKADHFYTKMVQRKALILGAKLARRLNDSAAADWYEQQVKKIEQALLLHIQNEDAFVGATLNWTEGLQSKKSNLDVAVLLGVLHGRQDSFFKASHPLVLNTYNKLTQVFSNLYVINKSEQRWGPALGRYPEDIYAGTNFDGGNPWVLATLAAAEYSYRVAGELTKKNKSLAEAWMQNGDLFVQRVQYHANADGTLSEQIDRHNGYMSSARDLTWNYSAVLTTLWARQESEIKIQSDFNKGKIK